MEPRTLNNKGEASQTGLEETGVYTGDISAAGAITNAPSGWTGGAPSSSVFTVTHNLNLTANSYNVQANVTGATEGVCTITSRAADSFTVTTFDLGATPAAADLAFSFMLTKGDDE